MKIEGIKITLTQDEDCCGRHGCDYQSLDLEILDGGGGPYAVITTERWALGDNDVVKLNEFAGKMIAMYGTEAE